MATASVVTAPPIERPGDAPLMEFAVDRNQLLTEGQPPRASLMKRARSHFYRICSARDRGRASLNPGSDLKRTVTTKCPRR